MEWYKGPVEGAGSARCAKLAWNADQLMDSAYPWGLPTLGINRNPFNNNNKSKGWLNFFKKKTEEALRTRL